MLKDMKRAKWDPQEKLWLVPYRLICGTELESRIPEEFLNGEKVLSILYRQPNGYLYKKQASHIGNKLLI